MNILFLKIYIIPLPILIGIIVFSIFVWSILDNLFNNNKHVKLWRSFNSICFLLGLSSIVYVTVICRDTGTSEVYLTPFYSYIEAQSNVEMYRTNLMNVFLFLPFGLSLPVILPASFKRKVLFTVLAAAGISVSVELVQFVFELGRVETDDVIHNTLGAALGALPVVVNRMRVKN